MTNLITSLKNKFDAAAQIRDAYLGAETQSDNLLLDTIDAAYGIIYPIYRLEIEEQDRYKEGLDEIAKDEGVTSVKGKDIIQLIISSLFISKAVSRRSVYSSLLNNAISEGVAPQDFKTWVKDHNGIDACAKSKSSRGNASKQYEAGKKQLSNAKGILVIPELKGAPKTPKYFLNINRVRKNGSLEVLGVIDDKVLTKSAISIVGKGEVELESTLGGVALEQMQQLLEDNVLDGFEKTDSYQGGFNDDFTTLFSPKTYDEVIFPNESARISTELWLNKSSNKLCFIAGPHGTGKTTLANLLPSKLYPDIECKVDSIELNQSNNKVFEVLKKLITDVPIFNSEQPQFVIINEAQHLTSKVKDLSLFRSELEVLPNNVHVIMTSNKEVIDSGLFSRAINVHMGRFDAKSWQPRVHEMLASLGFKCTDANSMLELTELIGGDIRILLKLMDTLVYRFENKSDISH